MSNHPYPSYASPVRSARMTARERLPCPRCDSDREPTIRRARPFTPEWEEDPRAYFGCRNCGLRLAGLSGPSAMRPSDQPLDRLPDPEGTRFRLLGDESVKRTISRIRSEPDWRGETDLGHIHPGLVLRSDLTVTFESRPLLEINPEE